MKNNKITDREIHQTFVKLGNNRRLLTNELLAMLPEIFERGIYKKYARTIEEYAGKFGGLSGLVVRKRLRLEKYVKDKPNLREAIATEGVHKVALVASLATVKTDAAWADKVRNMSKPAIQELSKEVRWRMEVNQGLFGDGGGEKKCKTTLCGAAPQRIRVELEGDLFFMFLKLKKKYGEKLSNQEVMKKIFEENLDEQNEKVEKMKAVKFEQKNANCQSVKSVPGDTFAKSKSRYSSVRLRRNLLQKTAGRCSYPECQRPAQTFHHTDRFANSRSHESLKPLCKIHHEFMHNGLIQNEKYDVKEWQLKIKNEELEKIDRLYRVYRNSW